MCPFQETRVGLGRPSIFTGVSNTLIVSKMLEISLLAIFPQHQQLVKILAELFIIDAFLTMKLSKILNEI